MRVPPHWVQWSDAATTASDTATTLYQTWSNAIFSKTSSGSLAPTIRSMVSTGGGYFYVNDSDEGTLLGVESNRIKLRLDQYFEVELPDGGLLILEKTGEYRLLDKDAKITYKANRVKEFNKYLNASDLIEEFIHYLRSLGLSEKEILAIPINLFIAFLVIRAAESDGEELPAREQQLLAQAKGPLLLPAPKLSPRCTFCGRFIFKAWAAKALFFCSPQHAERAFAKL